MLGSLDIWRGVLSGVVEVRLSAVLSLLFEFWSSVWLEFGVWRPASLSILIPCIFTNVSRCMISSMPRWLVLILDHERLQRGRSFLYRSQSGHQGPASHMKWRERAVHLVHLGGLIRENADERLFALCSVSLRVGLHI